MSEPAESSPDVESEEIMSIIRADSSESNPSAFQRYAIPPQFDGNSSEEDEPLEQNEEKLDNLNIDDTEFPEDDPSLAYQPLVADEFGDFVSSENFGDYYTNPDSIDPNFLTSERPIVDNVTSIAAIEQKSDEITPPTQIPGAASVAAPQRISIPPLDAGNI